MQNENPRWEHLEHGADIGIRGYGADLGEAFAAAGLALTALMLDPREVADTDSVPIRCRAPDLEVLFHDWVNALIFEMASRRMVFRRFEVGIEGHELTATAHGEAYDPGRHAAAVEPKGATFTELRVARTPAGEWLAQCVVDV